MKSIFLGKNDKILSFCIICYSCIVIIVKFFVLIATAAKFHRSYSPFEIILSFSFDVFIAILLSAFASMVIFFSKRDVVEQVKVPLSYLRALIFVFLSFVLIAASFFYAFSGCAFYEWGAFFNYHNYEAAIKAHVTHAFWDYVFSYRSLLLFGFIIAGLCLSKKTYNHFSRAKAPTIIFALFFFGTFSAIQCLSAHAYDPAVYSPFIQAFFKMDNSDGVSDDIMKGIDSSDFLYSAAKETKDYNNELRGIAKDYNVIFVVLDSVRKSSVHSYGYYRNTTPTLDRLSENSLFFTNAYVVQPRSVKMLEAFTLGVYPDPRMQGCVWSHNRVSGKDNFFDRMIKNGYSMYYGTNQLEFGGDNFSLFLDTVTNKGIDRKVDWDLIKKDAGYRLDYHDSNLVVADFLKWSASRTDKYIAMLWLDNAHVPYKSRLKIFGDNSTIDRYDNCIYDMDRSVNNLVEGLKKQSNLNPAI